MAICYTYMKLLLINDRGQECTVLRCFRRTTLVLIIGALQPVTTLIPLLSSDKN